MSIAISFPNKEKRAGFRIHPCLTPKGQLKNKEKRYLATQKKTKRYLAMVSFKNGPDNNMGRHSQALVARMHGLKIRKLSADQWMLRTVSFAFMLLYVHGGEMAYYVLFSLLFC